MSRLARALNRERDARHGRPRAGHSPNFSATAQIAVGLALHSLTTATATTSDSFADLWSATAPLPPKPKPQTLSGASAPQNHANKPYGSSKPDIFSLLASASPTTSPASCYGSGMTASAPSSCAMTPSRLPPSSSSRATPQPSGQAYSQPVSKANIGDAFGDLFASSGGKEANITLTARMALDKKYDIGRPSCVFTRSLPVTCTRTRGIAPVR